MTGLKLNPMVLVALFVLFRTMAAPALLADDIGDISELRGSASVIRDQPYNAVVNFGIQSNDQAITSNGRMAIKFLDESIVRLTEHSKLIIDEYVFDPNPSKAKMALTFGLGTIRFVTGNLNKIDKQNVTLKTPTADIAIRGTMFTATVDELGRSLIILLPDALGLSSGEIEVVTATGSVVLNKPYQATTVSVFESAPSKPVILDLTLDVIDNMLIVSPPEEDVSYSEESTTQTTTYLEFDGLDIDYLNEDFLDNESDLEFTELDINYLDVNFLEDLLDVIDTLAISEEEDQLAKDATTVNIKGTEFGQDLDTQITTFLTGEILTLQRNVSSSAIDKSGSYTVIFIQDGVSRVVTVNGGSSSVIKITQSN